MSSYPKYPSELARKSGVAAEAARRVGLKELMDAEFRVNQHPYRRINGWQVYQATGNARDFGTRGNVAAWHFWAAYWDLTEPVVVAETLARLEAGVQARQAEMYERLPQALRSRRILAERQSWPDGVVERCEELEELHPAWSVMPRGDGYAARLDVPIHGCELSAEDSYELDALMGEVPVEHDWSIHGCAWCLSRLARTRDR